MSRLFDKNFLFNVFSDITLLAASWHLAFALRFNFEVPEDTSVFLFKSLSFVVLAKIVFFYLFDVYRGMWRYTGIIDLLNIAKGSAVASVSIYLFFTFFLNMTGIARSAFLIDFVLATFLVCGQRAGIRLFFWIFARDQRAKPGFKNLLSAFFDKSRKNPDKKRLLIVGAGDCGEKIFREIHDNPDLRYRVVGFVDDEKKKINSRMHGIPVFGPTSVLADCAKRLKADEILIAIPSAGSDQMREIVERCKKSALPFKTVPKIGELINGKVSLSKVREVDYQDLLGREVVKLDEGLIGSYISGKTVMVTGAGGSIGSELCRQVCRFFPEKVLLLDQAESPLFHSHLDLLNDFEQIDLVPLLSDIRDKKRLFSIFTSHNPQVVFHAAAYKHVPMLESNPTEAVIDNINGTRNLIEAVNRSRVERFVFVSTDKAVRPANVMGASKRVCEMMVQGQNSCGLSRTRYICVRFGNVLGSVGSVVPLFKKQIEQGGPVTVTHPDVTRYFMTIPEACQLILQAGAMGDGGEIFLLDMGAPVKIIDMARDLIRFSGLRPDIDIPIKITGLRPGEKLREELVADGEIVRETRHKKIMVLKASACEQALLNGKIDELIACARRDDTAGLKRKLSEIVPGYVPDHLKESD